VRDCGKNYRESVLVLGTKANIVTTVQAVASAKAWLIYFIGRVIGRCYFLSLTRDSIVSIRDSTGIKSGKVFSLSKS